MERVAFLIERTGERITCLLNPEFLDARRVAGIRTRREAGGFLGGTGRTDHPLIATGGGITEFDLRLLFDTDVAQLENGQQPGALLPDGTAPPAMDVRALTRPIWDLSENATAEGFGAPPTIRFIWGKSWNIPGVIVSIAERLERFDMNGTPQRSWLTLRLRRVEEAEPRPAPPMPVTPQFETPTSSPQPEGGDAYPAVEVPVDNLGTPLDRLDQIANEQYGMPWLAPILGAFNSVDDLLTLPEGTSLSLPPLSVLMGRA